MVSRTLTGKLLVATPRLIDPNFYRSVVLIVEHGEDGALGLVLNRATDEDAVNYLPAWADHLIPPGLVHYGGPVEPDIAIGLGRVGDGAYAGVSGLSMVDMSRDPDDATPRVRVFSGYSGWSPGQLEEELTTGSWFVVPAAPDDSLADPDDLWRRVLRRQSGLLAVMSTFPDDPRLN